MNERIRELAIEAGEYVNSVYTPPVRSKTPGKIWEDGHIDWYTQFHQKFAELIVKECANHIRDSIQTMDSGKLRASIAHAATLIEEHFGVE